MTDYKDMLFTVRDLKWEAREWMQGQSSRFDKFLRRFPTEPKRQPRELFPGQQATRDYLEEVGKDLIVEGWYRKQVKNAEKRLC